MDITLYKVKTDRGFFLVNAIDDVEARSLMEKTWRVCSYM